MAGASGTSAEMAAPLGVDPREVFDEVANSFHDYICDAADAMEATLMQLPDLQDKHNEVKQGIDRWQLRMQRGADKNLDAFEARALSEVFAVPADLQLEPPKAPAADEVAAVDAETAALQARLQTALATRRELKRKLAASENLTALWEAHRTSVQQLAASQEAEGAVAALEGTQRLNSSLERGWQMLKSAEGANNAAADTTAPGPRGLQQRFSQRRMEISTVSVPDLNLLSSLLCAS